MLFVYTTRCSGDFEPKQGRRSSHVFSFSSPKAALFLILGADQKDRGLWGREWRCLFLSCTQSSFWYFGTKWQEDREDLCSSRFKSTKIILAWSASTTSLGGLPYLKTGVAGWKAGSSGAYCQSCSFWEKWQNKLDVALAYCQRVTIQNKF